MSRVGDLVILGPTASGKTSLAVGLARHLGGEVISVDSRQVYRGLDIGSGKDLASYAGVPVHLIDVAAAGSEYSLFEFLQDAIVARRDILARGSVAVFAGGTGLYLAALLRGYALAPAPRDEALRARLAALGQEQLVAYLEVLRPLHNRTDSEDRERTLRAIEIALAAGQDSAPPVRIQLQPRVFGLALPPEQLRQRILARLAARLEEGLVEEVHTLLENGVDPQWLEGIGLEYRYGVRHLRGDLSREVMEAQLAAEIWRFARQQGKWFRRLERQGVTIRWLAADADPLGAALQELNRE